jgi:hypothetical protein
MQNAEHEAFSVAVEQNLLISAVLCGKLHTNIGITCSDSTLVILMILPLQSIDQ